METRLTSLFSRSIGALTLLVMLLNTTTAWAATVQFPIYSGDEGTESKPYQVKTIADLNKLAQDVNSGTNYSGKYFKLMTDLDFYDDATLKPTTAWDDATSQENNFTAIGHRFNSSNSYPFSGTFDGAGHTIRGIRIYKSDGSSMTHRSQGLFGYVKDGTVKDVTLADARITGERNVGGIVGFMSGGSSNIENCHVLSNVTIHAVEDKSENHGGIAGQSDGSVSNCTSAATLTVKDGITGCICYGGIVGIAASGSLHNNLAVGVTIPEVTNSGAIAGKNDGDNCTFEYNYYKECSVGTTPTASGIGCNGADILAYDGAVPGYTLTLADGITATPAPVTVSGTGYYKPGTTITLSGRPTEAGYFYPYLLNGTAISSDTFTMPASDVTVTVGDRVADWQYGTEGSETDPFQIKTTSDLDLLALRVNGGNEYGGKYFKLMNDIAYAHTTAWNNATSTENNYTAIGNNAIYFGGTFDGDGHTISGIRIYKGGSDYPSEANQGLFGHVGGTVENVTLADTRITGFQNVGGIVGDNGDGTITGCHVAADVALHIVQKDASNFGGIAGHNEFGTVSDCTSAVKITAASAINEYGKLGGIVGINECIKASDTYLGTITNCHAVGASVTFSFKSGAIAGHYEVSDTSDNPLSGSGNTYHSCLVGSNAFYIGLDYYKSDAEYFSGDCDGVSLDASHFLLDDYMDAPALIAAYAAPSSHTASGTAPDVSNLNVTLQGRTLYRDGDWNTLCLPFSMTAAQVTAQLAPAALMTLSSSSLSGNTLTLNFTNATAIEAGKPYIIKWDGDGTNNLVNPVFSGVTINAASNPVTTDCVDFVGTYTPLSFTADDHTMLLVGTQNKLYYPQSGASLGICRAYFQLKNGLTAAANSTAPELNIQMNFDSADVGTTGVNGVIEVNDKSWYTLDGRKLNAQPTAKGIYINNGKKVVI